MFDTILIATDLSKASDCVLACTRGRGFFAEAFLGSVSLPVVRSAPAPVLLVPPVREQP